MAKAEQGQSQELRQALHMGERTQGFRHFYHLPRCVSGRGGMDSDMELLNGTRAHLDHRGCSGSLPCHPSKLFQRLLNVPVSSALLRVRSVPGVERTSSYAMAISETGGHR